MEDPVLDGVLENVLVKIVENYVLTLPIDFGVVGLVGYFAIPACPPIEAIDVDLITHG